MDIPQDLFLGDIDSTQEHLAPERKLYLYVFYYAFVDMIGGAGSLRDDAIMWFKGELNNVPVTFLEVCSIIDIKASRLEIINCYIEGKPVNRPEQRKFRLRTSNNKSVIR